MKKLVLFASVLVAVSFASCSSSAKQEAPATDDAVVEECCGKCETEAEEECCGKCEGEEGCCKKDSAECCGKCEADSAKCCEAK